MPSSAWRSDVCSRSEEHTSELQSPGDLVCRLLLEIRILKPDILVRSAGRVTAVVDAKHERFLIAGQRPDGVDREDLSQHVSYLARFVFFNGSGGPRDLPHFPARPSSS